mgnify:CR=1 FL=1
MAKDVLITPLDGIIQFSASDGAGTGQIKVDNNDLVISNLVGDVLLGDGASDVFIGNGSDNVDIVFEQSGEIRDDGSGKTITIGSKTTTLILSSSTDLTLQGGGGNVGIGTTTAGEQLEVIGNISASGFVSASAFGGDGSALTNISSTPPAGTISSSLQILTAITSSGNISMSAGNIFLSDGAKIGFSKTQEFGDGDDIGSSAQFSAASVKIRAAERVMIHAEDGKVGIDTETPQEVLTVQGNISASGKLIVNSIQFGHDEVNFISASGANPDTIIGSADNIIFKGNGSDQIMEIQGDESQVNITGSLVVTTNITASGNISLADDKEIKLGNSNDLRIFHDPDNGVIREDGGGDLFIQGSAIRIRENSDGGTIALFTDGAGTELRHDNVKKFETSDGGINVIGHITASGNISSSGTSQTIGGLSITPTLMNYGAQTTGDNTVRFSTDGDSGDDILLQLYRNASAYGQVHYEPDGGADSGLHLTDFRDDANSHIVFNLRGDSEKMRIESDGKVGIGTTSPSSSLNIATAQGDVDSAFRGSMLTLTPTSLINSDGFTGITMETSTNVAGYGISMGARRYTTDGKPAFVLHTHNNDLAGTERFRIQNDGVISFVGNITASGNISASGTMFAHTGSFTHVPTINGITTFAAAGNLDIGPYNFRARTLQSDVSTGTVPISISSTTKVTNLNADLLDDQEGSHYLDFGNFVIDDDEIPIAKLASDAITIGGAGSTALGGTATVANILKGSTVFSSSAQFQGENFNIGNMTASANISMSAGNIFVSDGAKIGYSQTQEFGDGDDTESAIKFNSANTQIIAGEKTMIHAEDGKVGIFTDTPNEVLTIQGNISASGKLIVDDGIQLGYDNVNFISASINDTIIGSIDDIIFKGNGSDEIVRIRGDESQVNITGSLDVTTNITASGDISVGGNITHVGDVDTKIEFATDTIGFTAGNRLFLQFAEGTAGGDLLALGGVGGTPPIIQGDITASGNISASGGLMASSITSSGRIDVTGRSTFGNDSSTNNTTHQFHGISGDDRFFMIADKDGEEVMTGTGEVAGGNLTFTFGDVAAAGVGTIYQVDDGNSQHILQNDAKNSKVGINTNNPTKALQVFGDISASGLVSAKQYQTYVCSFNDDMGTIEHGLPWGSTFENAFQADETVAFVVPCKTDVKHILMRGQGFDQNLVAGLGGAAPNIKFSVKTHSPHGTFITTEGNWTTKEVATVLAPDAVDTGGTTLTYARFSGSHAQGGDAVFIGMQFSADFSNGSDEFYITVVMEHDYNSLPVTGSSQRNLITGSIADGGGFGS